MSACRLRLPLHLVPGLDTTPWTLISNVRAGRRSRRGLCEGLPQEENDSRRNGGSRFSKATRPLSERYKGRDLPVGVRPVVLVSPGRQEGLLRCHRRFS